VVERHIDERIAVLLRSDGRMPISRLAARLEVPRAIVASRLAELRAAGHLQVTAVANPRVLGITTFAHVTVHLDGPVEPVLPQVRDLNSASLVSVVSGHGDLVVELRAPSTERLLELIAVLRGLDGVREIETLTYAEVIKSPFSSPHGVSAAVRLDELDECLLRLLQDDGRASFRSLADAAGVTESVARHRVRRMLDRDVVRVTAVLRRTTDTAGVAMGIGVSISGAAARPARQLASMSRVDFVATVVGRYDVLLTVSGGSLAELSATADAVRSLPRVRRVRTWVHLQMFRDSYRPGRFGTAAP
jgi:DNA-binding Lrp family transcriptional regulator